MQKTGYDFFACKDFVERKGLVSLNLDLLKRNMGNINYANQLKRQPQDQNMQQQFNYQYNPN